MRLSLCVCISALLWGGFLLAADEPVDYLRDVKPLLEEKCYSCHGVLKQEASLRLETREVMLAGGDSGGVIVPGEPDESLLLARVAAGDDERMPPAEEGTALKAAEIALLRRWIEEGASAPDEVLPSGPLDHWAYRPIVRPAVPDPGRATPGVSTPVDAFLSAAHAARGLVAQPRAERTIVLRRMYLDLIGLPPTASQLADPRPYEEIVDELLASPRYGERWGRHFMDIWRYSDWYGLGNQLRNSQKHLWHWRDWIIESLNEDKGYDRMIQEMLAGDELAPGDPDVVRATGFLARNYYLFNRTTWLDSTIEHTGKAFLGLTLDCAKCHDHKYDPISHIDYYSFRAIFEPHQVRLDPVPGEADLEKDGLPRVFDDQLDAVTQLHRKGDPKNPDPEVTIVPSVPELFAEFAPPITPVELPFEAWAPALRESSLEDQRAVRVAAIEKARMALEAAISHRDTIAAKEAARPAAGEQSPRFTLQEEFDGPRPDVWELTGEGWEFREGQLLQTRASRDMALARLREPLPRDFDLTCRYTTTGGTTYKSVTFRFDQGDEPGTENFVYTSAYASGPKLQIAWTRDGKTTYPPDGLKARPIPVGEPLTIRFAVRDRLVNVWINDEFQLAYRLPERPAGNRLSLSAFDATAAFDSLRIEALDPSVPMTEASNEPAQTLESATAGLKLAEARLALAEAELTSWEARRDADLARYRDRAADSTVAELTLNAAQAEHHVRMLSAEVDVLAAGSDEKKLAAARKRLQEAQKARAALTSDNASYTSLRASRKALETPEHTENDYAPIYPQTSTGRRLALARWITARENPLTARVIVNHVWMRHFGEPLVASAFDFGRRTPEPEHRELLDWLAVELIESGWSLKHLHRLMMLSEVYLRTSSTAEADAATLAADATNRFYWRMNPRRMESQIVRDSLLYAAGELDQTLGGPPVDPGPGSRRRSLYFRHSRDHQDQFLSMFDDADLQQCYRRSESIVPQQALALANSRLTFECSSGIAGRFADAGSLDEFISRAFFELLARTPTEEEQAACREYCREMAQLLSAEPGDASVRTRLVHVLLNHNDFITIR